jgi:hypothetical protein
MERDKDGKAIIETLNTTQARAHVDFLKDEWERHLVAYNESADKIIRLQNDLTEMRDQEAVTYIEMIISDEESAMMRHQKDMDDTEGVINKTRERFRV